MKLIDDLVRLDQINMTDILSKYNKKFDFSQRIIQINKILNNGHVIVDYNNKILLSYVLFEYISEYELRISSIQLNLSYNYNLRKKFILQIISFLLKLEVNIISTYVYKLNHKSISLHYKLGFERKNIFEEYVRYEINKEVLLVNLKKKVNYV